MGVLLNKKGRPEPPEDWVMNSASLAHLGRLGYEKGRPCDRPCSTLIDPGSDYRSAGLSICTLSDPTLGRPVARKVPLCAAGQHRAQIGRRMLQAPACKRLKARADAISRGAVGRAR
jgi:hypothetical protein